MEHIGTHLAERLENNVPAAELWHGRRAKILDGTTASMPDSLENQATWPRPASLQAGGGFPLVKLVGLFRPASGALLHVAECPNPARTEWKCRGARRVSGKPRGLAGIVFAPLQRAQSPDVRRPAQNSGAPRSEI